MKKKYQWKPIVVCILWLVMLGCSDTKEIVLPVDSSSLGMLGYKGYAKLEEPFEMACPLRLAEHAKVVKVTWSDGSEAGFVDEDEQGQQVSYKTFVWNEPGEKEVVCNVCYSYGDEMKEIRQTVGVYVVSPVWGKCYLGDCFTKVQNLHPEMELCDGVSPNTYIERTSPTEYSFLKFVDDKLFGVSELEEKTEAEADIYRSFMDWVENDTEGMVEMSFGCSIINGDITDEDRWFVWEIRDGRQLSETDIIRLNRLMNDGFVRFMMKGVCDYTVFSYEMKYEIEKSDNIFYWIKQYSK